MALGRRADAQQGSSRRTRPNALIFAFACGVATTTWAVGQHTSFASPPKTSETSVGASAEASMQLFRRHWLMAAVGATAAAPVAQQGSLTLAPARAEDEGKDDKADEPEALELSGRTGTYTDINGIWEINQARLPYTRGERNVYGKRINNRAIYKKGRYFLVFNDCKQFEIKTKVDGECGGGIARKFKEGWRIEGETDKKMKLKPVAR